MAAEIVNILNDPTVTWYGPHACGVCGVTIVKAANERGGAEFEPPALLMQIYQRGSESNKPDLVYPMSWKPHQHIPALAVRPVPQSQKILTCLTCGHQHYFEDDSDAIPWGTCRECACKAPNYNPDFAVRPVPLRRLEDQETKEDLSRTGETHTTPPAGSTRPPTN